MREAVVGVLMFIGLLFFFDFMYFLIKVYPWFGEFRG